MLSFEELDQRIIPAITRVGTHAVIDSIGGFDSAQVYEQAPGKVAIIQIQRVGGVVVQKEFAFLSGIDTVNFNGGSGNDAFYATNFHGTVNAFGNDGDDTLYGGLGSNVLVGGAGNDIVVNILAAQGTTGVDGENQVNLGL